MTASDDEKFLKMLAGCYSCEFRVIDLNKFCNYKKLLQARFRSKYKDGNFRLKRCNFVAVMSKNNQVILSGRRSTTRHGAISNLKAAYAGKYFYHPPHFNYTFREAWHMFEFDWLGAKSTAELELICAIRKGQ